MNIESHSKSERQPVFFQSATVDASYVLELTQGARKKGFNINSLLKKHGVPLWVLKTPKGRASFQQIVGLSAELTDLMNDEFYGLTEKPHRKGTFKFMCTSAITAETTLGALKNICQYYNLYENTWSHELTKAKNIISYKPVTRQSYKLEHPIALELWLSCLYRTLCWMSNTQLPLKKVNLAISQPGIRERYRFLFHDAPITFEQPQSYLDFQENALQTPIVRDKHELKSFLKQSAIILLTQTVPLEDMSGKVRAYIESQLLSKHKIPSIEQTCEYLNIHPQALRRKLIHQNTSYSDIKLETRRDLAINMMNEGKLKIFEIGEKLNYSETSAFIRAFKQWTGLTPKHYQQRVSDN